jgi:Zn-dependent protease
MPQQTYCSVFRFLAIPSRGFPISAIPSAFVLVPRATAMAPARFAPFLTLVLALALALVALVLTLALLLPSPERKGSKAKRP